ncbi:peroxidase-related enzyme [Candidatus Bipolaricaulota bacterium]|nr:peroxidase-related enzyme [Candidatus Bipolaricaulota bacterium]
MAWIRIVEESEADDELRKVYQQVVGSRGKISNILAVHSLHPPALRAHMDLYMAIMFDPSGLSREEREMIAVVVSSTDQCPYCIQHHSAALSHYWKDDDKLATFIDDYQAIDLTPKMEAVLDYAFKLTTTPHAMAETDVQRLRDCGIPDEDILTITLIVSYFNFVNRIALGLGVSFTPDEVEGYQY